MMKNLLSQNKLHSGHIELNISQLNKKLADIQASITDINPKLMQKES